MAMNFAPLDCSCQGVSSEPKKIYLDFSVLEKFAKTKKSIFLAPTAKNGFNGRNFYYILNSTRPIPITDSNLVRIGDKKFSEKNHVPPPSI
jgi:hypothetical protein